MPRSYKSGADGVVSSAGLRRRAELTTPSATNRNGSIVFDVAGSPPARRGMCCPENFVQKTKSCSLVTQKNPTFFCLLWLRFVPFVYLPRFAGQSLRCPTCILKVSTMREACLPQEGRSLGVEFTYWREFDPASRTNPSG